MKKTFKYVLILLICVFLMSGCFKRDDLEGVDIFTTVYPIQYATDFLYGYNSKVKSIYPAETDTSTYSLNDKQIEEYSKGAIFVYNGMGNEKSFARDLLNKNKKLRIIDVSQGLEYVYKEEELWLNPSDYLMLVHNIKNGLEEYINNKYIIEEINKNYDSLKLQISAYDADLQMIKDNASDMNILIASDSLSFLSKYRFDIINIDATNKEVPNATKTKAQKLIKDGTIKYIYMIENQEKSDLVKELENLGATVITLRNMTVLKEEDIQSGNNFKNMMRDNIEELKREVYENK